MFKFQKSATSVASSLAKRVRIYYWTLSCRKTSFSTGCGANLYNLGDTSCPAFKNNHSPHTCALFLSYHVREFDDSGSNGCFY